MFMSQCGTTAILYPLFITQGSVDCVPEGMKMISRLVACLR